MTDVVTADEPPAHAPPSRADPSGVAAPRAEVVALAPLLCHGVRHGCVAGEPGGDGVVPRHGCRLFGCFGARFRGIGAGMQTAEPGWYPDPTASGGSRYWDGARWTKLRSEAPPPGSRVPPSVPPGPWWTRLLMAAVAVVAALAAAVVASVAFEGFAYFLTPAEPVDYSTEPLEVVVNDARQTCSLNVEETAPGEHEVHVIAVGAPARVVVRDSQGSAVFRAAGTPDGSAESQAAPTLRLDLGLYRVECRSDAGLSETRDLLVIDAAELRA